MPYRERPRVALEYGLVQLAETNCPITDDAPPASENSIDETIEFSSHTVPQRTQTASPRASSGSMSFDPHEGHWSDMSKAESSPHPRRFRTCSSIFCSAAA